ncbi:hypothetical protein ABFZ85_04055 [Hyphococcus formosus]|uniref:hypothetical protein n=1 Tax=Hyphococcus formosus TaxID=3143534 RepID=UPI00398ACA4A
MQFKKLVASIIALAVFVNTPAIANDTEWPAYEVPRSIVRTIASQNLGRSYDLYIKMPARVYFAVGELETNPGRDRNMVADQMRFVSDLKSRNYDGLEVRSEIIPGATHKSTFPIGLTKALFWMLEGPKP